MKFTQEKIKITKQIPNSTPKIEIGTICVVKKSNDNGVFCYPIDDSGRLSKREWFIYHSEYIEITDPKPETQG